MDTINEQDYQKIIQSQIRTLAFKLAEQDGFRQAPEYYWIEAEIKLLYDYK